MVLSECEMGLRVPWSMQVECAFSSSMSRVTSQEWLGIGFKPAQPAGRSCGLRHVTLLSVFRQEGVSVIALVTLVLIDLICIIKLQNSASTVSPHTKTLSAAIVSSRKAIRHPLNLEIPLQCRTSEWGNFPASVRHNCSENGRYTCL